MRNKKLNDLLRDVVAKIVEEELDVEGTPLVTVMGAEVSPTGEHALVKISVLPPERSDVVLKELHHRIYDLQQMVNKSLVMRPVPKIRFEIDSTEERAARIEKLLETE
ncbi:MAG: ribosome-binding factor A [Patescibacteria group bacterium]